MIDTAEREFCCVSFDREGLNKWARKTIDSKRRNIAGIRNHSYRSFGTLDSMLSPSSALMDERARFMTRSAPEEPARYEPFPIEAIFSKASGISLLWTVLPR